MKRQKSDNYLDYIPRKRDCYAKKLPCEILQTSLDDVHGGWCVDESGRVTVLVEHNHRMDRLAQRFLHKPRITQVHLEEMGSFIWQLIDGERSVYAIGQCVSQQFGERAEPLYERLVQYMQSMENAELITKIPGR
jgi:hypothetical protein